MNMPRVVGLDLSLQCSGIGVITQRADGSTLVNASVVRSSGKRSDGWRERSERVRGIADEVLHVARRAELVVIEDVFTGPKAGSVIDRAGLLHRVVSGLIRSDTPFAVPTGTALKSAIAGSGNADKAAMTSAVLRLWPSLDVTSSDVIDGVGLAHVGAVRASWDVPTLARHRDITCRWPDLPDPAAAA